MFPNLSFFGLTLPSYTLMLCLGAAVFLALLLYKGKKEGLDKRELLFVGIFVLGCCVIGAKLLYALVTFLNSTYQVAVHFREGIAKGFIYLFSGFVYYGGVIGGLIGVRIYCRINASNIDRLFSAGFVGIPLMHAIGRIGCFLAGCCYGIEYEGFGAVTFPSSAANPVEVSRFPVQLLSAAVDLIIFAALSVIRRREKTAAALFGSYLLMYGTARLAVEFLRGDILRRVWGGLLTTQYLSSLAVGAGIWLLVRAKVRRSKIIGR